MRPRSNLRDACTEALNSIKILFLPNQQAVLLLELDRFVRSECSLVVVVVVVCRLSSAGPADAVAAACRGSAER
jgi:hypothetical protein